MLTSKGCFKKVSEERHFLHFFAISHESPPLVSLAILSFECEIKAIKSIVMCPDFQTRRAANRQVLTSECHEGVSCKLKPGLYLTSESMRQPYLLFTPNLVLKWSVYFIHLTSEINHTASRLFHNVRVSEEFLDMPLQYTK